MRIIKFRGKRTDNGEWVYGYYKYDSIYNEHLILEDGKWFVVTLETVGQFTGLFDKNEKEIYEGDITHIGIKGSLARIIHLDGAFQYEYLTKPQNPDAYRFEYHKMNKHEVVGNIHDNPELLKQ